MIRFRCPSCGGVLKAPDRRAGDDVPCPRCGQLLQVPSQALERGAATTPWPGEVVVDCQACGSPLQLPEGRLGQPVDCPKCRAAFTPLIGRPAPAPLPPAAPDKGGEDLADAAVTRGLARDSELEAGRLVLVQPPPRKARVLAVLAVLLAAGALPPTIGLGENLLGVALAAAAALLAVGALFASLRRRGAGLGLCLLALVVCGSTLHSAVMLAGGPGGVLRAVGDWVAKAGASLQRDKTPPLR